MPKPSDPILGVPIVVAPVDGALLPGPVSPKQAVAAGEVLAEPPVSVPAPRPTRIEPVLGADGRPTELVPPGGSRWIRDADGGLTPADAETAEAVGLRWAGA